MGGTYSLWGGTYYLWGALAPPRGYATDFGRISDNYIINIIIIYTLVVYSNNILYDIPRFFSIVLNYFKLITIIISFSISYNCSQFISVVSIFSYIFILLVIKSVFFLDSYSYWYGHPFESIDIGYLVFFTRKTFIEW